MEQKKFFLVLGAATLAVSAGAGALIYNTLGEIEEKRAEVGRLTTETEKARKTVEGTPTLEREVIVLREISEVIGQILPSEEAASELTRDLYGYAAEAGVEIDSSTPQTNRTGAQTRSAFDTVGYKLSIVGDTFAFLEMLHKIEAHQRLIAVPGFTLKSASRDSIEDEGVARHSIDLNVETYTYERGGASEQLVEIEGYERKRELLAGEITRRKQALNLASFEYRGPRGRRDPWVDPRVPADDPENSLSVQEQMELVDSLRDEVSGALGQVGDMEEADNMLAALVVRRELERAVVRIESRLRQVESEDLITYTPAKRRLETDVYVPLEELALELNSVTTSGPSKEVLVELHEQMRGQIEQGSYEAALVTYDTLEGKKELVQADPVRKAILERIETAAWEARTLRDFGALELAYGGVAIIENLPPHVVINGMSLGQGDLVPGVAEELEVLDVRPEEVDFHFRGVVLTRIFGSR